MLNLRAAETFGNQRKFWTKKVKKEKNCWDLIKKTKFHKEFASVREVCKSIKKQKKKEV